VKTTNQKVFKVCNDFFVMIKPTELPHKMYTQEDMQEYASLTGNIRYIFGVIDNILLSTKDKQRLKDSVDLMKKAIREYKQNVPEDLVISSSLDIGQLVETCSKIKRWCR